MNVIFGAFAEFSFSAAIRKTPPDCSDGVDFKSEQRSLAVHCDQLGEMLVALHRLFLVQLEQDIGT